MSDKAELVAYRAFVGEAVSRIEALHDEGQTLDQIKAAAPFADFNRGEGFIDADGFITAIHTSIANR